MAKSATYKVGDTYHHRLWAQIMRWATAGRLPAGTEHVKLGSDRVRYRAGERITLRGVPGSLLAFAAAMAPKS